MHKGEITGLGFIYKKAVKDTGFDLMMGVQTVESAVYDGAAQLFDVVVLFDGNDVVGSNDYTVTYLDPTGATITADRIVNAGTHQVAIKGRNAFKGSVTKQFTVTPAEITEAELSAYELRYTGAEQKPTITSVKSGNATLATTDYTVAYSSETVKGAGTYALTVTAKGNFVGSKSVTFKIFGDQPAAPTGTGWRDLEGGGKG